MASSFDYGPAPFVVLGFYWYLGWYLRNVVECPVDQALVQFLYARMVTAAATIVFGKWGFIAQPLVALWLLWIRGFEGRLAFAGTLEVACLGYVVNQAIECLRYWFKVV